jgi:hypothetical protein
MIHRIDMSLAPVIDWGHVYPALEDTVRDQLSRYPRLLDRIQNSITFLLTTHRDHAFHGALLRASLTELVSTEDVQRWLGLPAHHLNDSGSPLLSVSRELRNLELHLSSPTITGENRDLLWGKAGDPENARPVNWEITWIDDLDISKFEELRGFDKKYDRNQFKQALDWFDDVQRKWGIEEIVIRAIHEFAKELISRHC